MNSNVKEEKELIIIDEMPLKLEKDESDSEIEIQNPTIRLKRCDDLVNKLMKSGQLESYEIKLPSAPRRQKSQKCETKREKCPHCPKTYAISKSLKDHIRGIHRGELKCNDCNKIFGSIEGMNYHMSDKSRCALFKQQELLKNQFEVESSGKFKCPHCPSSFLTRYYVR